ncbi:phage tail sheath subtilisin-like domain-containing protein [Serratia ureilytica]|uniref:phage tail sheath family protein n=1 Tax=Serratia ureilytica TaxID=300181 RepID=UPI002578883E|nr:phage tail sheath C-terminal domain-containing protein [Serratia ureilytica]MDM1844980.1 phage tail sheath subtilisin-like domain-containing protein [Serratia ureilytica]WIF09135.1 phage tail sheath subtilisin-like domain-containing protein [Serratia sp. B1]
MATDTTVPGVYIEEDASPAMSVSAGATAVPLFVARFTPSDKKLAGAITRIGSWLDYTTLFDSNVPSSARVTVTSTPDGENKYTYQIKDTEVVDQSASVALRLYFQNGGGPCYLYPLQKADDQAKLAALPGLIDEVGAITLLACPEPDEAYRTAVYAALAASLNQHKGYFLLADSSDSVVPSGVSSSSQVAVYYPNLVMPYTRTLDDNQVAITGYTAGSDTTIATLADLRKANADFAGEIDKALAEKRDVPLSLPPSALMAGVYNKTDGERGVWKAPANVVLNGVSDVSVRVTNEQQAELNPRGINVIRHFSDRGLVVWGSRTQKDDDDWRYIPVRRLFDAAERDIKKALQPMVFEPNSQPTWKRVQAAIDNYLHRLWQQGALAGNKAEEAYFVRVGKDITMTQDEINQGKMIIQVGMAAVRPAEFIILKFTQDMSQ